MPQSHFKLTYVPELDGLRGLAILAVMFFHANAPILSAGFIGVDIFFVLSGFLITSLIIQEFDSTASFNLKNFYIRRILRLFPALIALLVVFCISSFIVLNLDDAKSNLVDALIALFYLSNWARAFSIRPPNFLWHTWSLSIEEQFYILWPIILLGLLRITKNRWYIVITAMIIALFSWFLRSYLSINGVSAMRLYNGLDTRADTLMLGCMLGILLFSNLISENFRKLLSKSFVVIAPFSAICLLLFSTFSKWDDPRMYYWGFSMIELLTVALILDIFVNKESVIGKILATKLLVWIGSISYGLYLWHFPIYKTMFSLGFNRLTVITLGTLITFVIAICSYYLLEKPILKFKKHFTRAKPDLIAVDSRIS